MKGKYLGESKTHYKMYKKGKTWVTMGITLLSVGLGLEFGSSANADAVSDVSNSSNNSSVANKNTSSQANVVQLKSSSAKTSVANTQSSSAKASVASTQSSSKQNMSSAVKTASPRESQPINFAVKNSASTVNTTSQQSVYDGQSGEPTNRSQAGKDIQNADSMQIYLINKENGKVLDQREALWNSSSKENNTYYGDNFNGNTSGVTFTSPNGDVTVHPLDGWKFDIPYTEWFDNQRNGVQSTDTIKDDNGNVKATSTDGYWSKEPTSNAITFSFANAQKVTNGTLKHSKDDAIQLFMSPINDNDGNTESHPTPQKDSYQVVINWVNTQYPNNNKNSEDNVPDGQVIGQTVMNLDYGKYGSNGRDVLRGMYNANTNPVGDYQVYAPDGYRFAFPNEVENSYLTSGENGHVARYSTWDQTGHFHWNNYQTVVKVYVTTDSSWKRPANAADGYVPMWKDASTTSKPAASTTVNKPAQQPAASTTVNKPAQQPAASTTVNKPAQQPVASTTANKPAQQPVASTTANKPAQQPAASTTVNKPAQRPAANTTVNKPAQQPAASTTVNKPAQQPVASTIANKPAQTTVSKPVVDTTMVSKPIENRSVASKPVVDTQAVNKPTTKQTLKKTESSTVKTVEVTGVKQAEKVTNSGVRSVASKKASLPVTGESSNSLKEIGLVMSSAVLGMLGLFGFADKKKH